jgi:hypothetical protein
VNQVKLFFVLYKKQNKKFLFSIEASLDETNRLRFNEGKYDTDKNILLDLWMKQNDFVLLQKHLRQNKICFILIQKHPR